MARLSVSPDAKQDLVEVFLFIAQDNLEAARRMHSQFQQNFPDYRHPAVDWAV